MAAPPHPFHSPFRSIPLSVPVPFRSAGEPPQLDRNATDDHIYSIKLQIHTHRAQNRKTEKPKNPNTHRVLAKGEKSSSSPTKVLNPASCRLHPASWLALG